MIQTFFFFISFQSKTSCCVITLSRWLQSEYPKSSKLYHQHIHDL